MYINSNEQVPFKLLDDFLGLKSYQIHCLLFQHSRNFVETFLEWKKGLLHINTQVKNIHANQNSRIKWHEPEHTHLILDLTSKWLFVVGYGVFWRGS